MTGVLASWNDSPTKDTIVDFIRRVATTGGPDFVPEAERIAIFDNDGTLWCEKPMPIELGFILARLADLAEHDAALRNRQPWKAAFEKDYAGRGDAITKHYRGDDSDLKVLLVGIRKAFEGISVEDYSGRAGEFLDSAPHPTLNRLLRECGYAPMVELLRLGVTFGMAF